MRAPDDAASSLRPSRFRPVDIGAPHALDFWEPAPSYTHSADGPCARTETGIMKIHSLTTVVLAALAASPVAAKPHVDRKKTAVTTGAKGGKGGKVWPYPPPKYDDVSERFDFPPMDLKDIKSGTKEWFDVVKNSPAGSEAWTASLKECRSTCCKDLVHHRHLR